MLEWAHYVYVCLSIYTFLSSFILAGFPFPLSLPPISFDFLLFTRTMFYKPAFNVILIHLFIPTCMHACMCKHYIIHISFYCCCFLLCCALLCASVIISSADAIYDPLYFHFFLYCCLNTSIIIVIMLEKLW